MLILGSIAHDINAFGHFVILVLSVNHVVSDFVDFICLSVCFNLIGLNSILFIVVIFKSLNKLVSVIFL